MSDIFLALGSLVDCKRERAESYVVVMEQE